MLPALLTDTVSPDLARAAHYALLWGLEGVVLRTVGTARVPDVNEAAVRSRLAEADLPVVAVAPGLFEGALGARASWLNDAAALAETLAFARRVGAPLVAVGALGASADGYRPQAAADALRPAADAAARAGCRLALCNEPGTAVPDGDALADVLDALAHPAATAGWQPADEPDPDATARRLLASPGGLGLVTVTTPLTPTPWLDTLAGAGWDGPVALAVGERPAAPAGLAAATDLVQRIRAARRAARASGSAPS